MHLSPAVVTHEHVFIARKCGGRTQEAGASTNLGKREQTLFSVDSNCSWPQFVPSRSFQHSFILCGLGYN